MALRPKHRREIRELLQVLYDDRAWRPIHTDTLLRIVRTVRSDVVEEVEETITQDLERSNRANLVIQRQAVEAVRDVEKFRDLLRDQHAKIAVVLEALVDGSIAKALIDGPNGKVLDPALIDNRDAKITLAAIDRILKVTGAAAPAKIEVESAGGGAFDLLDAVEAEEVRQ